MNSVSENTKVLQKEDVDVSMSGVGIGVVVVDDAVGSFDSIEGTAKLVVTTSSPSGGASVAEAAPLPERENSDPELAQIIEMKGDVDVSETEEVPVQDESDGATSSGGPGRSASPGSVASNGTSGTSGSAGSKTKRRSWKKPKDKPKRPLSAYNIFFKFERSRIVEGKTEDPTADETTRSIEIILSTSRETRRHRKTHGRITFGDLARRIADKWKAISTDHKALFEHYAGLDMRRYRKEVQRWKEKKEHEALTGHKGQDGSISYSDSISEYSESCGVSMGMGDPLGTGSGHSRQHQHDPWAPRMRFYENMSNSFSSVDSEFSLDPLPMHMMQQQHQQNPQPNSHSSMPNLRANFRQNSGAGFPGMIQSPNNSMFIGMQQQQQAYEQDLSPMDFGGNNQGMSNMLLGTLGQQWNQEQRHQQQPMFDAGFQQQQQMSTMHHSFSGRSSNRMRSEQNVNSSSSSYFPESVPMFVGRSNTEEVSSGCFQPGNGNMGFSSPVQPNSTVSFHSVASRDNVLDPVPFNEVFPDETVNGDGKEIELYLSNLDLSHM